MGVGSSSTRSQQVQYLQQQVQQAIQTVQALTNIPQNLAGQVVGLLQSTIQNPLQGISLNLQTLMTGSGPGVCMGAGGMLSATQAWTANGGDFLGSLLNGGASRLAGLMACTNQMMQATEQRLTQMPQLLSELQNCSDVTCATTLSGRIQLETATINAQQQQAILMGLTQQQQQRWAADDLVLQKMRADPEAVYNALPSGTDSAAGVAALVPAVVASAPVFSASVVHPLASRVPVMKALLARRMLALSIGQAGAVCVSHSPYDPRCTVQDLLDPTVGVSSVLYPEPGDHGRRRSVVCTRRLRRGPTAVPSWCAAAFAAQRIVNGARYGQEGIPDGRFHDLPDYLDRLQQRRASCADFNRRIDDPGRRGGDGAAS